MKDQTMWVAGLNACRSLRVRVQVRVRVRVRVGVSVSVSVWVGVRVRVRVRIPLYKSGSQREGSMRGSRRVKGIPMVMQ